MIRRILRHLPVFCEICKDKGSCRYCGAGQGHHRKADA